MFSPLVEYTTHIWSPHLKSNLKLLESVQRSFTKRLPGLSKYLVVDSGFISDHQLILATLHTSSTDSSLGGVPVTYRRIKDIDPVEFEARLRRSSLFSSPALTAESYASQFEEVVVETLDAMAPLRTRVRRPPKEITRWLSDEAVEAKRERRRLEKRWSSSKSDSDRIAYRRACRRANKLINESRKEYFRSQLSSSENCRERWQITKRLLHSARTAQNRAVDELQQLCDKFAKFLINKITSLKHSVALTLSTMNNIFHAPDPIYLGEPLDSVTDVTVDEVFKLISSMPSKSSSVDFIPTSLIKLCPLVFSEIIANLANLSFSQGIFPAKFKEASVVPLLKKPSLDPDNPANYRPISNLNNISKMLERLFLSRFYPHVTSSPHFNHLQSAYRKFHSTESALLHTFDSIYRSADQSKPTFLVSLDLSAAFDTIDHSILLNRLSTSFGVSWFSLSLAHLILIRSFSNNPHRICCFRTIQLSVWCPSRLRPRAHTFLTLYLPSWAYHLQLQYFSSAVR